ncbi:MAG: multiheme c-type cytochrome [Planctomycetia bacterium]|nr:multiheme c-type cytochrome [Planctomycetia bacterium]
MHFYISPRLIGFLIFLFTAGNFPVFVSAQAPSLFQSGIAPTGKIPEVPSWWRAPTDAEYCGSESCRHCHPKEYTEWKTSHHSQSMAVATEKTVLGNFCNAELSHFGKVAKMTQKDQRFYVETENLSGKMQSFPISYVFGVYPLQQYLVKFQDGRVQCLPQAWDSREKKWFHLYPNDPLPPEDELYWRRPLQNWNYMCADCHSTNIKKNFNPQNNTYNTTWSEIHVGCEACHGPGSAHIELAEKFLEAGKKDFARDENGSSLTTSLRLTPKSWHMTVETCGACHARRRSLFPDWKPGTKLMDHYIPELLDTHSFYADGQILEEDFEYTSFLQSNMYNKGVACADCHNVHSGRLLQPDNHVCTRCHIPMFYDTPAHHHHPDSTKPGTKCVECHLPPTVYMGNDIRYDHSIRRPRPDLSLTPEEGGKLKTPIPNACNHCHHDESKGETALWAHQKCREWYGPLTVNEPHFAISLEKGRLGITSDASRQAYQEGEKELISLLHRKDLWPIVRASALLLLSHYHTPDARNAGEKLLNDPNDLIRYAALRVVSSEPHPVRLFQFIAPKLKDPLRAIRLEACAILAKLPVEQFPEEIQTVYREVEKEYLASLDFLADQPESYLNRGIYWSDRKNFSHSLDAYLAGKKLFPRFLPVRNNLGMLYNAMNQKPQAEQEFRAMIQIAPDRGESYYSLGLLLAESPQRLAESTEFLQKAAEKMKNDPRVQYNCALALMKQNKRPDAALHLLRAWKLAPENPDYPHALTILYIQEEDWENALKIAENLAARWPEQRSFQDLLEYCKENKKNNYKK